MILEYNKKKLDELNNLLGKINKREVSRDDVNTLCELLLGNKKKEKNLRLSISLNANQKHFERINKLKSNKKTNTTCTILEKVEKIIDITKQFLEYERNIIDNILSYKPKPKSFWKKIWEKTKNFFSSIF